MNQLKAPIYIIFDNSKIVINNFIELLQFIRKNEVGRSDFDHENFFFESDLRYFVYLDNYEYKISYNTSQYYHLDDLYFCDDIQDYSHDCIYVDHLNECLYYTDDLIYDRETGEYYTPEYYNENIKKHFTFDYHTRDVERNVKIFKNNSPIFTVGLEIEKEDIIIKESIDCLALYDETNFIKEHDGSLCDDSGFELVSPLFELDTNFVIDYIKQNKYLVKHINADYSDNCGGHIHLGKKGTTGLEFFNEFKGYTPLLHAMYPNRVDKNYSVGKPNEELINDNCKYQSVQILNNRIEIRIFSAVQNINNLKWRLEFLELLTQNLTSCPKEAFFNLNSVLKDHFMKIYTVEKFAKLNERVIKFSKDFENICV